MNKDFGVMDVGVSHYMTIILFSFAAFVPIKLADVSKPTSKNKCLQKHTKPNSWVNFEVQLRFQDILKTLNYKTTHSLEVSLKKFRFRV